MNIFDFLDTHDIPYERYEHPPVYTCEEANRLCPDMPSCAIKTKNLFLRDKSGKRHFLVTVADEKRVDIKALGALLNVSKLSFASPARLDTYLGLEPGSVTILGVLNDTAHAVEVVLDTLVWRAEAIRCHPLINTSTLVLARDDIARLLDITGHTIRVLDIPEKDPQSFSEISLHK